MAIYRSSAPPDQQEVVDDESQEFNAVLGRDIDLSRRYALQARSKMRKNETTQERVMNTAIQRGIKKASAGKVSRMLQKLGLMDSTILSRKADEAMFKQGEYRFKMPLSLVEDSLAHKFKQALWFKAPEMSDDFSRHAVRESQTFKFWQKYFDQKNMDFDLMDVKNHNKDVNQIDENNVEAYFLGGVAGAIVGFFPALAVSDFTNSYGAYLGTIFAGAVAGGKAMGHHMQTKQRLGHIEFSLKTRPVDLSHLDDAYGGLDDAQKKGDIKALADMSNANDNNSELLRPQIQPQAVGVPTGPS